MIRPITAFFSSVDLSPSSLSSFLHRSSSAALLRQFFQWTQTLGLPPLWGHSVLLHRLTADFFAAFLRQFFQWTLTHGLPPLWVHSPPYCGFPIRSLRFPQLLRRHSRLPRFKKKTIPCDPSFLVNPDTWTLPLWAHHCAQFSKTIPCHPIFPVGPSLSLLKLGWDRRPVP